MQSILPRGAIALAILGTLAQACGRDDTEAKRHAIEAAVSRFGQVVISTGSHLNLKSDAVAFLKAAEAEGLVTLEEIPQDYWGGFATQTFMEGAKPYRVTPTQALIQAAGRASDSSGDVQTWRFSPVTPSLGQIVSDEEYKGPLAPPGETCRLILAKVEYRPVASWEEDKRTLRIFGRFSRFFLFPDQVRCVVKYSPFDKNWTVVAMDVGDSTVEPRWQTSNVK